MCLGLPAIAALCVAQAGAELTISDDFEADDAVQSLTVQITVDADGEDIDEPVALDLGLGFPFWLHPWGRADGEAPPFGAVPQLTTAGRTAAAGEDARFTFSLDGESGQDQLRTSSQLLAGVRVSDISRIGFAGEGTSNWILQAYEVRVNGKPFVANDDVNAHIQARQETARARLAELDPDISPLTEEAEDLIALIEAGLATDEDRGRLQGISEQLIPLLEEQNQLERQLQGSYPWLEEPGFRSPWREGETIHEVKIALVTAPHTGADTRNHVYFRTGGHKYLLSSPARPLGPEHGPQAFQLDLLGGPLTAGDLRGIALGMVAHSEPHGEAPDRWHPQRMLVQVDGRVVYDSEDNEIDRMSLESIRIIPPAHHDGEAQVVQNTPTARETFVWQAGTGAGLDLAHGGAADLPNEDDPEYPEAEPGLELEDDEAMVEQDICGGFDPDYPPFPAEECFGPDWAPADPGADVDGWDPGGGWAPPPSWLDYLFGVLELAGLPPGADPGLVGEPFRVANVRHNDGRITWEVTGDTSDIARFDVMLLQARPDLPSPLVGEEWSTEVHNVDQREISVPAPTIPDDFNAATRLYLAPVVTAVSRDPAVVPSDSRMGPAFPLAPGGPPDGGLGDFEISYRTSGGAEQVFPLEQVATGELPAGSERSVLMGGQLASHMGLVFDALPAGSRAFNLAVRPEAGDDWLRVRFRPHAPIQRTGRYRVIAYAGFLGGSEDLVNRGHVELRGELSALDSAEDAEDDDQLPVYGPFPTHVVSPPADGVAPRLARLEFDIDPDAEGGDDSEYVGPITFQFEGGDRDPDHPLALFGVRLIAVGDDAPSPPPADGPDYSIESVSFLDESGAPLASEAITPELQEHFLPYDGHEPTTITMVTRIRWNGVEPGVHAASGVGMRIDYYITGGDRYEDQVPPGLHFGPDGVATHNSEITIPAGTPSGRSIRGLALLQGLTDPGSDADISNNFKDFRVSLGTRREGPDLECGDIGNHHVELVSSFSGWSCTLRFRVNGIAWGADEPVDEVPFSYKVWWKGPSAGPGWPGVPVRTAVGALRNVRSDSWASELIQERNFHSSYHSGQWRIEVQLDPDNRLGDPDRRNNDASLEFD
jgi:hypothetical protein